MAIFWKREVDVKLIGFVSKYHIDTEITEKDGFVWRFSGLYGEPKMEEKDKTWKLLRTLKYQSDKPWLCAGDFNEVLFSWEKEGGVARSQTCMDKFKQALEECELDDLGFKGDVFTWQNHSHVPSSYIRERLDRAVASQEWRSRFPAVTVVNGDPCHSDHRPIIIDTYGAMERRHSGGGYQNPKFEARWVEEEGYRELVKEAWEQAVSENHQEAASAIKGVMAKLCS